VLGSLLAVLSAFTFAFNNATLRRGVLSGSVIQALAITVPIGVPIFFVVALASGNLALLPSFPPEAMLWMAGVGLLHFIFGRYCNYRSTAAIGANLSAPVVQLSLVVALVLAVVVLREPLTPLRVVGILLVVLGPALTRRRSGKAEIARIPGADTASVTPTSDELAKPTFKPRYLEGYLFGLLAACAYGITPIMVRTSLEHGGAGSSLIGGLISYGSGTAAVALFMLWPNNRRHALAVKPEAARWFAFSGVFVCLSQMFIYMAYAIAPVSAVTPLLQLQLIFRYMLSRILNPQHEVFGGGVILGTAVSLLGAVALSVSNDAVLALLPLPDAVAAVARWQWP
jgi:drug/metabolite transporter (DMT)-like permease